MNKKSSGRRSRRSHSPAFKAKVALAAQEGGNQSVHGRSVAQLQCNRSYDRVNSCWGVGVFFACGQSSGVE